MKVRGYANVNQCKRLKEVLSPDSADMHYTPLDMWTTPWVNTQDLIRYVDDIPCWSLAALFNQMPTTVHCSKITVDEGKIMYLFWDGLTRVCTKQYFDIIDAAVEMVLKLNENKDNQQ